MHPNRSGFDRNLVPVYVSDARDERHTLTLYLGEIKTWMQDSFPIQHWYHFEISERP
jgi:hypothetical protein